MHVAGTLDVIYYNLDLTEELKSVLLFCNYGGFLIKGGKEPLQEDVKIPFFFCLSGPKMIRKQYVSGRKKSIGFQHSKYASNLLCLVCFIV